MPDTDKIRLKGMVFSASVGVADWEREIPTRLEIDLEMQTSLQKPCTTDNVHDTINYSEAYDIVRAAVDRRHYNLLESLAEEIAGDILKRLQCRSITVSIRKPHPPVKGACAFAEVEITRNETGRM